MTSIFLKTIVIIMGNIVKIRGNKGNFKKKKNKIQIPSSNALLLL